MARIVASAEGAVDASADTVYRYIADMREHHPRFLPPAFSDFRVESGGVGAGTITRFKVTAGGRTREFRTERGYTSATARHYRTRPRCQQNGLS